VRAYYSQSIFKQLLTEGERYMITMLDMLSFSESGVYDIINNLGSLIARFLFLPIEDASYIFFTNSLHRGIQYKEQVNRDDRKSLKSSSNNGMTAKAYLELMFKVLTLVGLVVFVFGQGYSQLLLKIYYGARLSENVLCVNMLRLYCFYVLFLALNGISECFFNASISESEIQRHNYKLIGFSISFLVFTYALATRYGIYGFVLANALNMAVRIFVSLRHVARYSKASSTPVRSMRAEIK
jgi:oligosaccharide translocation protein RFT1